MDGKCGNILRMEQTFKTMKQPDIISYTTMAKAYILNVFQFLFSFSIVKQFNLYFTFSIYQ